MAEERQHPAEQQQDDRRREAQLRAKMGQRHGKRVMERTVEERAEIAVGIHRPPPTVKVSIVACSSTAPLSVAAVAPAAAG